MASDKSKARKTAASAKTGDYKKSSIGAKARAAASKLKEVASKPRDVATGKHHAPSAQGAAKNAYGDVNAPSKGKHSRENPNSTISKMSQSDAISARRSHRAGGKPAEKTLVRPANSPGTKMSQSEAMTARRNHQGRARGETLSDSQAMSIRKTSRKTLLKAR